MVILVLFFGASFVDASSLAVSPVILDRKAKARDILKESLTVKNISGGKASVYICVNNISVDGGNQEFLDPSRAGLESSLANWIEVTRGVIDLAPGEERKIDITIGVNLRADPGIYHAVISFPSGSTRAEAELKARDAPNVIINLEVEENAKEWMQLKKFVADRSFFWGWPVTFSYILENTGDKALAHSGNARIYDSSGREVAEMVIDKQAGSILPENEKNFSLAWQRQETLPMGRYKAYLSLEYGAKQRGVLQDTVFFWVFPKQKLLMVAGIFFICIIFYILLFRLRKGKSTK